MTARQSWQRGHLDTARTRLATALAFWIGEVQPGPAAILAELEFIRAELQAAAEGEHTA
jgi:hypothetical protein